MASLLRSTLLHYCPLSLKELNYKRVFSTAMDKIGDSMQWTQAVNGLDSKQVESYHNELLIRVDENDSVLGPISKGQSHAIETIKKGIYHRALSLLIFDEQNRFLLTQRASCKITFANYFTNACCSHPLFNKFELEDDGKAIGVRRAVIRRSNFELGIGLDEIKPEELKFVNRLAYRAESDGGQWGEAEIDYIFVIRKNIELNLNPDEVQSHRYVTKSEMRDILLNYHRQNLKVTPWVRLLSRDLLFKYWDNLNDLDKIAQPEKIIDCREIIATDEVIA